MWPIVKYRDTAVSCAKMAEPIEMTFLTAARVDPRKHVLGGGAHWRHLLNTIKSSMYGGDAVFCQITLTTCYDFRCHSIIYLYF